MVLAFCPTCLAQSPFPNGLKTPYLSPQKDPAHNAQHSAVLCALKSLCRQRLGVQSPWPGTPVPLPACCVTLGKLLASLLLSCSLCEMGHTLLFPLCVSGVALRIKSVIYINSGQYLWHSKQSV